MAIPQQIIDLTDLALQDRELTFKERHAILKAALDLGVSVVDANKYIDDAFRKRLQSYKKEDLRRCPSCGAQIPLISVDCLFCGQSLETDDSERRVVKVGDQGAMGDAADIIREENRKTAEYQQSIAQCPDCGAALPLVSHICTYCGHILHEQTGSQYNIQQILHNINESIRALRSAPKPGFFKILTYNIDVAMAIIGAIITVNVDADTSASLVGKGVWYVLGFVLLAASPFVGMFLNMKSEYSKDDKENLYKTSPIELADQAFYNALAMFDSYTLQIATLYGNNSEAKTELGYLDKLIKAVKKERAKHRAGVAAVYVGVVALIIIIKYMSL
jgi:rRNA maturation endonuclease Nob1